MYLALFGSLLLCFSLSNAQIGVIGGIDTLALFQRALKCPGVGKGITPDSMLTILGAKTGRYQNKLDYLTQRLYPKLYGLSCLTSIVDPLTAVMVPAPKVKSELERCQRHLKYRVDSKSGCVYNVNAPYHDAWASSSLVYLEDGFLPGSPFARRERVSRVRDFSLPCEKKRNMRKLAVVRDRCRRLRELVINPACNADDLRTTTLRANQIHDCALDKIDDKNLHIASSYTFTLQCVQEEKRDC